MGKRLTQRLSKWQLILFAVAAISLTSVNAFAGFYSALERRSQPLPPSSQTLVVVGESLPDGLDVAAIHRIASRAAEEWNSVACSSARLSIGESVDRFEDVPDGASPIAFVDPDTNNCFAVKDDIGWTLLTPCCLGTRGQDQCDGVVLPSQSVLLNLTRFDWRAEPDPYQVVTEGSRLAVDVESVLVHELGHVLGLGHDETDPLATMRPRYLLDGGLATITAQDKAALCENYPVEVDECTTDGDCGGLQRCVGIDAWRLCDEFRGELGSYCSLAELHCPGRCLVTSEPTYSGYCTVECDDESPCPDGYSCADSAGPNECVLDGTPAPDQSCSVAGGALSWVALVFGLVVFSRRRRS